MPRRSAPSGPPHSWVTSRGNWPAGPFRKDAPVAVPFVAHVAARLREELDRQGLSVAAVAESIGVAKPTVYDILNGEVYLDTNTLATLEKHLETTLWPSS